MGPRAIRDASHMLCDGIHSLFNISPIEHLTDYGDLTLPNTSLSEMRKVLEPRAEELMRNHHMVWLGGDHSVTLSLLRAQRAKLGTRAVDSILSHNVIFTSQENLWL